MGALKKACLVSTTVRNTGVDCNVSMGATEIIFLVHPSLKFTETDMEDPVAYFTEQLHADIPGRVFPLGGNAAPIRRITPNKETDPTVTLDDGTIIPIRYGVVNKAFGFTDGGLCLAKALQGFNKSGYSFIEVDAFGNFIARKNADGTYSGLRAAMMWSPSPDVPDIKNNVYFNNFQISYKPEEYVGNGVILNGEDGGGLQLLDLMGLIDAELYQAVAATVTQLFVGIRTECAGTNLVTGNSASFGTLWEDPLRFLVTNKATGATVTITDVNIVSDYLELLGTFVSGQTYNVKLVAPSVLFPVDIDGIEGPSAGLDITIP